jgi:hypothetical protein
MFEPGDVIEMFAPQVGYKKFWLCVCGVNAHGVLRFFYINSGSGYEGDLVYNDHEFPYLPKSPTGQSVISLSYLPVYSEKELKLYRARKLGELDKRIIHELISELPRVRKLTRQERNFAIDGLKRAV